MALSLIAALSVKPAFAQDEESDAREYQPLTPRGSREVADDGISNTPGGGVGALSGFRGDCAQGGVVGREDSEGRYFESSISATQIYTDNVNLEPEEEAESDFVSLVTPRIGLCAATGRVHGQFSYTPQAVVYAHNSQFNDIYHSVAADSTVNIYDQRVFVDADTRYGQAVVQPSLGSSDSNAIRPQNQTTAWISSISPYALQSLGGLGTASARYRYGVSEYGDDDIADTTIQSIALSLFSPPGRELGWRANVVSQQVERSGGDRDRFFSGRFEDDNDGPQLLLPNNDGTFGAAPTESEDSIEDNYTTYFDKAELELNRRITRTFSLLASAGLETSYDNRGDAQRFEEPFYGAGARFTSGRNELSAGVSEHYYGTSFDVSLEREGPRLRTSVEYREFANSAGRSQFNSGLRRNGFAGGEVGADTGGEVVDTGVGSLFGRGVFIETRTTGSATLYSGRATIFASIFQSDREYQRSGIGDQIFRGASIGTEYELQPRTELLANVDTLERVDSSGDRFAGGYRTVDARIALQRDINRTLRGSFGYRRSWGGGDNSAFDYTENRLTLSLLKSF